MKLQQLEYLVATAETGSMTRAADRCHVAQPALTRSVRALERELGVVVFARQGRGIVLTDEGRFVVEVARRILADVEVLQRLGRRAGNDAVLVIAATRTLQADLGAGLVRDLWQAHPELPVRFEPCDSREHVGRCVLEGRAHVGVTDLPAEDGLVVVPLEEREVVVLAPPGTSLPEPFPLRALGDLPLIVPTKNSQRRAEMDQLFATLGIDPTVVFESDERSSWVPAVLAGVGCCVWYRTQGQPAAAMGAEVRSFDPPLHRPIGLVHRPGPPGPAVEAVLEVAARYQGTGAPSLP